MQTFVQWAPAVTYVCLMSCLLVTGVGVALWLPADPIQVIIAAAGITLGFPAVLIGFLKDRVAARGSKRLLASIRELELAASAGIVLACFVSTRFPLGARISAALFSALLVIALFARLRALRTLRRNAGRTG